MAKRHYGSIITMPKKALAARLCRKVRKGTKVSQKACVRDAMKLSTVTLIGAVLGARSKKAQKKRPYYRHPRAGYKRGAYHLPDWI